MANERMRAGWEARIGIIVYDATTGAVLAGYNALAPRYFACKKWSIKPKSPPLPADNTEGKPGRPTATAAPGYSSKLRNIKSCDVRLEQVTYDDANDPFSTAPAGAGYSIREGVFMKVFIWPNRDNAGDLTLCHSVEFIVEEIELAGEVGGYQPVTITGSSDGAYAFV